MTARAVFMATAAAVLTLLLFVAVVRPAIDRGGSFCPATDQRGKPRNAAHCDAGAYER